jgi:hypothetical protein
METWVYIVLILAVILIVFLIAYLIVKSKSKPKPIDTELFTTVDELVINKVNDGRRPSEEKFTRNFDDDGRMSMRPSKKVFSAIHDDGRRPSKKVVSTTYDDGRRPSERIVSAIHDDFGESLLSDWKPKKKRAVKKKHRSHKAKSIDNIIDEFVDPDYTFNFQILPEVTRKYNPDADQKYIDHIAANVKEWNHGLHAIQILPEQIRETSQEFYIKARIHVKIYKIEHFVWAEYYGRMIKADDYLEGGQDECILQLVSLKPMSKESFYSGLKLDENPFMSMSEQIHHTKARLDDILLPM